jgi:hypothetical protein
MIPVIPEVQANLADDCDSATTSHGIYFYCTTQLISHNLYRFISKESYALNKLKKILKSFLSFGFKGQVSMRNLSSITWIL